MSKAKASRAHGREEALMEENRSLKRENNEQRCEINNLQMVDREERNAPKEEHMAEFKKPFGKDILLRQKTERDKTILNDTLAELVAVKSRVEKLEGCKNVAERKNAKQSKALTDLERTHTELNKKLEETKLKAKRYEEENKEYEEKNNVLLRENKRHQEKNKKYETEIETSKKQGEKERANIKEKENSLKKCKAKCQKYSSSCEDLKTKVGHMIEREMDLLKESKDQEEKAKGQCVIIAKMKVDMDTLSNTNKKLLEDFNLLTKQSEFQKESVQRLRNQKELSENENEEIYTEMKHLENKKELLEISLNEAQEELKQKASTTTTLQKEFEILKVEADANKELLDKANHKCKSLEEKLKRRRSQLAEKKKEINDLKKTDNLLLVNIKLNEVIAEKEKLEKEVLNLKVMVDNKDKQISLKHAEIVSFQKSNQDSQIEVSFLQQENSRLQDDMYITKSKHRRTTVYLRSTKNFKMNHLTFIQKKAASKKNKEITELRRMLERRPDDAIQKLQECQWDYRHQSKQLQAAEGTLTAYEKEIKRLREENQELTDTQRKLKLENRSKHTHLPPISQTHKPPTEDKSKDQCRLVSIKTCLPNIDNSKSMIINSLKPFPPPRS